MLDMYSKSAPPVSQVSEGSAFAQGGRGRGRGGRGAWRGEAGRGEANTPPYNKEYWKDKKCFNCGKQGHPSSHCKSAKANGDKDDDKSSKSKSTAKSTASSTNKSLKKLKKQFTKTFTTLETRIDELENESDLSSSEGKPEASHFQYGLLMMQQQTKIANDKKRVPPSPGMLLQQGFEKRNANVLFKQQNHNIELDLTQIILLDNQSTMDLFCNPGLVDTVTKSRHNMKLKSNGGTMTVDHKATVAGYNHKVWFSINAITNIISLKNLIT